MSEVPVSVPVILVFFVNQELNGSYNSDQTSTAFNTFLFLDHVYVAVTELCYGWYLKWSV